MESFKESLLAERDELVEKIQQAKEFPSISKAADSMLRAQIKAMELYHEILDGRINFLGFGGDDEGDSEDGNS